jgi:hypothetical protein
MFAYQARPRDLFLEAPQALSFPGHVRIEIRFQPNSGLGGDTPPGRTAAPSPRTRIRFDTNTGHTIADSDPALPDVTLEADVGDVHVALAGHLLTLDFDCQTRDDLIGMLNAYHYLFPLLISAEFLDPPVIQSTGGFVRDVPFTWQIHRGQGALEIATADVQRQKLYRALLRMKAAIAPENRRLIAALSYFQRAVRLVERGNTVFEFLAESILNYCKCLEVLFSPGRDATRTGLLGLGFTESEVETWFIPCMVLRSEIDTAHVGLALFTLEQLLTIQLYAESVESWFRKLFERTFTSIDAGTFTVQPYDDGGPDASATATLDRLRKAIGLTT